jgi:hypothetical protein
MWLAKSRSWPVVRPRSPSSLTGSRPVSAEPIAVIASARASISSAIRSRKAALSSREE